MEPFADKQLEFILNSNAAINLAHGSVRSGKTVCTLYRFMQAAYLCPDTQIWMIGHTSSTIYDNVISLLINPQAEGLPDPLSVFRPFCMWMRGERELRFGNKIISTIGVNNAGSLGVIQGKTFSLCYCDEMTLYPVPIIDMIHTRLSLPHSQLFASMNPMHPTHKLKEWIDKGEKGDPHYYGLHFTIFDNPFLPEAYINSLRDSLSGVFYKRYYLGQWCLAEGSIFDFFDKNLHVQKKRFCAEYWIVGVDYGTSNAFAAVLIGINTGQATQTGKKMWVEDEYYWDSKKTNLQKTNFEYVDDLKRWLEPYAIRGIYVDPSAEAFRLEMQRKGMKVINANNDVQNGIQVMTMLMKMGDLTICPNCKNLIREIESYVWDPKTVERGEEEPLKRDDHSVDALRYAVASHKVSNFNLDEYNRKNEEYMRRKFFESGGGFR
jgi:PBSX family phage terminase large subunit